MKDKNIANTESSSERHCSYLPHLPRTIARSAARRPVHGLCLVKPHEISLEKSMYVNEEDNQEFCAVRFKCFSPGTAEADQASVENFC